MYLVRHVLYLGVTGVSPGGSTWPAGGPSWGTPSTRPSTYTGRTCTSHPVPATPVPATPVPCTLQACTLYPAPCTLTSRYYDGWKDIDGDRAAKKACKDFSKLAKVMVILMEVVMVILMEVVMVIMVLSLQVGDTTITNQTNELAKAFMFWPEPDKRSGSPPHVYDIRSATTLSSSLSFSPLPLFFSSPHPL